MLINTDSLPRILSEETRLKLSESRIGFKFSQESKDKMSKSAKGKKHSPERILKHQQHNINRSIPIICTITKEMWYSVRKCAKDNSITKSTLNNYLNNKTENKTTLIYLKIIYKMNKILIRIILSPFILIWGVFFTAAMCLFPIPLVMGFSFIGLISQPFIYLLRKGGTKIKYCEPFLNENDHRLFKNYFIANLIGILLPIILPFLIMIIYIIENKIITSNEY